MHTSTFSGFFLRFAPLRRRLPLLWPAALAAWLVLLSSPVGLAQSWLWAKQADKNTIAGANTTNGQAVQTDAAGNVYVLGGMSGSSQFGSTTLSSSTADITLSKFDAAGNWQWAKVLTSATLENARSMTVASNGDVYIAGSFETDPNTGANAFTIGGSSYAAVGGGDIIIVKYNTGGTLQWAVAAGGAGGDFAYGLALDGNGDLLVTGTYTQAITFGSTPQLTNAGSSDIFVAKLKTSDRTWTWAKRVGGSLPDVARGVALDGANNVYITGNFRSTSLAFGSTTLNPTGAPHDVYLAKMDTDGNWQWAVQGSGSGTDLSYGIATDAAGNSYITGSAIGTLTFGTLPAVTTTSTTESDVLVAKANSAGVWQWVKTGGSTGVGGDSGYGIDLGADDNIYITGGISASATFGTLTTGYTGGSSDMVVAKISPGGAWQWVIQTGGDNYEQGTGIAADGNGTAYVTSTYQSGSVAFGTTTLSSNPSNTMFVARVGIVSTNATPTDISLSATAVNENQPSGTAVGNFSTTDADVPAQTFTYTLVTGTGSTDNASFSIVGNQLRTAAVFNYEAKSSYAIRVRTTDSGSPARSYEKQFTITVNDLDEVAPTVAISSTASSPTSTSPIPIRITFSESVSGFGSGDVTVLNGSVAGFSGSGSVYNLNVTPPAGGVVTVNVAAGAAQDAAGNGNTAAPTFTITYLPNLTVSTTAGVPAGSYNNITVTGTGVGTLAGAVSVAGALTVQTGGTLDTNCQLLTGAGTFTLNSGATLGICDAAGITSSGSTGPVRVTGTRSFSSDATYTYNGTATQVTGSGLPASVRALSVNNEAGLALSQPLTVSQSLSLLAGVLTTGAHKVVLGSAATLSETASSYVTGTVEATRLLNAAGTANTFGGLGVTLTPSGSTLPGSTLVKRVTGTALNGQGSSVSIKRYYDIQPTTNAGLNVTLVFGYAQAELNGLAENQLTLFRSSSGLTGPWQPMAFTSRDATANTVTHTGVNHFSIWTLGATGTPLPVVLAAFTAERTGTTALLRWRTAQEQHNAGFEVEASADGQAFERIGHVAGRGNSSQATDYRFTDANPARHGGRQVYYRLRQVDLDGTATLSPVQVVALGAAQARLRVAPNPATGQFAVYGGAAGAVVEVYDATGRLVQRGLVAADSTAQLRLPAGLPAGIYLVRSGAQTSRLAVEQ